jgi:hypothetical protein
MTVHQPRPAVPEREDSLTGALFMTVHQPRPAVPEREDSLIGAEKRWATMVCFVKFCCEWNFLDI